MITRSAAWGICTAFMMTLSVLTAASPDGYYKSVDSKQGFTTSIIAVYTYDQMVYGRIIVAFDEEDGTYIESYQSPVSSISIGNKRHFLVEIDLFFGLKKNGSRYTGGKVVDVKNGNIYGAQIWRESGDLILRGMLGPFGMKYRFCKAVEKDFPPFVRIPRLDSFVPYTL